MRSIRTCYLILGMQLAYSNVFGSECGILRLEESRSFGTEIRNNACVQSNNLSIGASLKLNSNSRLWLDSVPSLVTATKYKIICQNQSSLPVTIKIASPVSPWINPEGKLKCKDWIDKRLECQESGANKVTLICAIALKNKIDVTHQIQSNASVNIRGIDGHVNSQKLSHKQAGHLQLLFEKDINPRFDLCESLFDREVAIAWTIGPKGQVDNVSITTNNSEDQFAKCVVKVIKASVFPSVSNNVQMYSTFR